MEYDHTRTQTLIARNNTGSRLRYAIGIPLLLFGGGLLCGVCSAFVLCLQEDGIDGLPLAIVGSIAMAIFAALSLLGWWRVLSSHWIEVDASQQQILNMSIIHSRHRRPQRYHLLCLVIGFVMNASPAAARFADTHRANTVSVSQWQLKHQAQLSQPVAVAPLTPAQMEIVRHPPVSPPGLFESEEILPHPPAVCHNETWTAHQQHRCRRQWEQQQLHRAHGQVVRQHRTLVVKHSQTKTVTLRDWHSCASGGECDAETFTYLGPLGSSPYHAVELSYGHDSPSLVLINAHSGKLFSVHYGSEPTFLNGSRTLVVNVEDLNPPLSLIATALNDDGPRMELHCLGTSSAALSLHLRFQGWLGDQAFVLHLTQKSDGSGHNQNLAAPIPILFEKSVDGHWLQLTVDGTPFPQLTCRQRKPR